MVNSVAVGIINYTAKNILYVIDIIFIGFVVESKKLFGPYASVQWSGANIVTGRVEGPHICNEDRTWIHL